MTASLNRILVVGMGPVGLALALALLKHPRSPPDLHLILVDSAVGPSHSGAFGLTRNGLHVLDQLGIHPPGQFVRGMYIHNPITTKTLQALGMPKGAALMIERAELVRVLLEEVTKVGDGRVEMRWGARFSKAEEVADGVKVILEGEEAVLVDFLVGADGVRSRVRDFVLGNGDWAPFFSGFVSVYGVSDPPPNVDDSITGLSHAITDPSGVGGYESWDLPNRRQYWHIINISDHPRGTTSSPRFDDAALAATLDQHRTAWHPIPGGYGSIIDATEPTRVIKVPILSRFYDKWHNNSGTAAIIGDAAHPLIPSTGQGVNMGLEDTIILANSLFPPPGAEARGPAWYTQQRIDRLRKVGKQSAFIIKIVMGETFFWRCVRYLGTLVAPWLPKPKPLDEWEASAEIRSEDASKGPLGWIHGWKVDLGEW